MGSYTDPQPPPVPNDRPATWDLVIARQDAARRRLVDDDLQPEPTPIHDALIADMETRKAMGRAKYGVDLQSHNGRDSLVDLYQELLDVCVYSENVAVETDGLNERNLADTMRYFAYRVRLMIYKRDGK